MRDKLLGLKKEIENIEITYDIETDYTALLNATIDFGNETQEWLFDGVFEDYIDEYSLSEMVKHKIENEGLWSVQNVLSDIENYEGIYYIDAYGYGHDVDKNDVENIKDSILDIINDKLESEEYEPTDNASE